MNSRRLKINKSSKIFNSYTSLDVPIARQATTYGFALIGGTAVEHFAHFYGIKKRRARSNNDLDFITPFDNPHKHHFLNWLYAVNFVTAKIKDTDYLVLLENKEEGVEVDLLFSRDSMLDKFIEIAGGFLVASPVYLFVAKIQRLSVSSEKKDTDIQDLNTLYDIIEYRNELDLLQDELGRNNFQDLEEQINEWLKE